MTKILLSILFIVGTVATGTLYLNPAWQEFKVTRQRNQKLETISVELDDLIKNRDDLVALINRISKDDLKRIDQAIPLGQKGGDLVIMLENASIKNGVILQNVDFTSRVETGQQAARGAPPRPAPVEPAGTATLSGNINEFSINIKIKGSYEAFKAFLGDLEKGLRIINLKTVTFSAPGEEKSEFDVNLNAVTYYQQ